MTEETTFAQYQVITVTHALGAPDALSESHVLGVFDDLPDVSTALAELRAEGRLAGARVYRRMVTATPWVLIDTGD